MKKFKLTITIMLFIILLTGCSGMKEVKKVSDTVETETSMFVEIEQTSTWRVVYHKETKVMYVVSDGSYNYGTFTLLVDTEGNPLLYEGN